VKTVLRPALLVAALALLAAPAPASCGPQETGRSDDVIALPAPRTGEGLAVERALAGRRSVREFGPGAITLGELAQLLWAAQGLSDPEPEAPPGFRYEWRGGRRTAPSAGALYPLELYVVAGRVEGLEPGLYRYLPSEHALRPEIPGDLRPDLAAAALGQASVRTAPASLVFAGVVARTAAKYGGRAERYVHVEVGAAGENVYLQCESLGLGTVMVGAFRDEAVKEALDLPEKEDVFAIMPVGRPEP
jgi:SagB-type dehydrogenase family enzyme